VLIMYQHFVILCINYRRKVMANYDSNFFVFLHIFCFSILGDIIERVKIKESRTYLVFAIGRNTSHSRLKCYAKVL
jgi:hypothetical protein